MEQQRKAEKKYGITIFFFWHYIFFASAAKLDDGIKSIVINRIGDKYYRSPTNTHILCNIAYMLIL